MNALSRDASVFATTPEQHARALRNAGVRQALDLIHRGEKDRALAVLIVSTRGQAMCEQLMEREAVGA